MTSNVTIALPENVNCPSCQQLISGKATVCPQCRTTTLVDLLVPAAVSDERLRYRAARLVCAAQKGLPLASVQAALAVDGGRLLSGVMPALAELCASQLGDMGVPVQVAVASKSARSPTSHGPSSWPLFAVGAAIVLVIVGAASWRSSQKKVAREATNPSEIALTSASATTPSEVALPGAQLAERGLASTVLIRCEESIGSGFFISKDRVLTNAHVLCPADETLQVRTADGRQGTGSTVWVKEDLDLALIETSGIEGTPLALGDAGTLRTGDSVVVIGAPKGMEFSVSKGVISSLDRSILGVAFLQTDAAVNPGNSGGPMLDGQGRVVGVVSLKRAEAEGISLVLPINYAFAGAPPLIDPPVTPVTPGFAKLTAAAEAKSNAELETLRRTGQRPGLLEAKVFGPRIAVSIIWALANNPGPQRFTFVLWRKHDRLCSMDTEVQQWTKTDVVTSNGKSIITPQVKLWLERNGYSSDLYGTRVLVDYTQCPLDNLDPSAAIDLELEGADSDASRIRL